MSVKAVAKFQAALEVPLITRTYRNSINDRPAEIVKHRLLYDLTNRLPNTDPLDVPPAFLSGGIVNHVPGENNFQCTLYSNNSIGITRLGERGHETVFEAAPDIPIDFEYLANTSEHPLLVDLIGASLKVYDPSLVLNVPIEPKHFSKTAVEEANRGILEFLAKGGVNDKRALNVLGIAAGMDTSGLRLPTTPYSSIREDLVFTQQVACANENTTLYYGAGVENLDDKTPLADIAVGDARKQAEDRLVEAVRKQIEFIKEVGERNGYSAASALHHILMANPMLDRLPEDDIVRIIQRSMHNSDEGGKLIANGMIHLLGSPYNDRTNYMTDAVIGRTAEFTDSFKTSPPIFASQAGGNYPTIKGAGAEMFTGDDKNFALLWLWGAIQQLEHRKQTNSDETYTRNGFHFIKGANIHGLLGNTAFNPRKMIAANIELSKWYHAKVAQDESTASKHLNNYLEIMLPYTAMSMNGFFSRFDHTLAYPWNLERNHIFEGIVNPQTARVAPWRKSQHEGSNAEKLRNGSSFFHWALNRGNRGAIEEAFEANRAMFTT